MSSQHSILVLGGGPGPEREVSLDSSKGVADALRSLHRFDVHYEIIDALPASSPLTLDQLRALPGSVILPVLHGGWGEGGPLQDLLELDGRPYVGCRPHAARLAMDKIATKLLAATLGIPTAPACIFHAADDVCTLPFPVVMKPVHEGSSVGVHIVRQASDWPAARDAVRADMKQHPSRVYLIEQAIFRDGGTRSGRELTVGVLDGKALRPVEIIPAVAFYDYEAKYKRDDTRYQVGPELPAGLEQVIRIQAEKLFAAMGCRHLSRIDFMIDGSGNHWLLEVNTMPGFTSHSLLPMGAKDAGLDFATLAATLAGWALRDGGSRREAPGHGSRV
jgi:D-alanine-D-alanine ligase